MDTPSSNNSNYLVYAVGFLAAIALIVGIVAITKISKAASTVDGLTLRVETMEGKINTASDAATRASNGLTGVRVETQRSFDQVSSQLAGINSAIARLQSDTKAVTDKLGEVETRGGSRSAASSSGGAAASGATPGQLTEDGSYVIKSGDTFGKIAAQYGVSIADIQKANPGVDPRKLHVGQKIVVPKKGG